VWEPYEFSAPLIGINRAAADRRPPVDWPTLGVAVGVYVAFGLLTWYHSALPWWLVLPLGAYIVALHGSLQHEAVHGYPFRRRLWNSAIVFPSLWLWLPYAQYRHLHLIHHRNERLTSPADDPESNYLTPEAWAKMGALHHAVRKALTTCAGRLVLGPPYYAALAWLEALRRLQAGDWPYLRIWLLHIPAVAIVLVWVIGVCQIPFWQYVLLYVWPGLSLTLLRSYLEHQGRAEIGRRTVVVEAGLLMSLVYLNNNLHAVHHLDPAAPWHQRRRRYREIHDDVLRGNGGYRYRGYGEILARYLLWPKEPVIHPLGEV